MALGSLAGLLILRLVKGSLKLEEQLIWGIPIGLVIQTFFTFIVALIIKNQDWALIIAHAILVWIILYFINLDKFRASFIADLKDLRTRLKDKKELIPWLIVMLPWLAYSVWTVPQLLRIDEQGNLIAGWINVWGDWAVHLRNSTFMAEHTNLSLEHPLYSGSQLHYPYLSSYLSALLQRLGLPITQSLTWPTFIFFAILPGVLYIFGRRITGSRAAGTIFTYLVLLAGGLGIMELINDLLTGKYFWETSAYSPITYTDTRNAGGPINSTIWFMNFIMSEFIPQRAFLMGLPVGLYILYTVWHVITELSQSFTSIKQINASRLRKLWRSYRYQLILAGILFGIIPLAHTHSFIVLGLVVPTTLLIVAANLAVNKQRQFVEIYEAFIKFGAAVLVPATLLGFGLFFAFLFDRENSDGFFFFINWWIPNRNASLDNPLLFWIRNAGPIIVFTLVAFFINDKKLRPLIWSGFLIFIVGNFISFQPWHFDNLKLLTYWYILWSLPVAVLLASLTLWLLPLQVIAILLLTGAGLADTLSVGFAGQSGILLTDKNGINVAKQVNRLTRNEEDALILSATNHDSPISLLSGRRIYAGYDGWLWSYGIQSSTRASEIAEMYRANQNGLNLIRQRGFDYIVIGPQERDRYQANEIELTRNFLTVYQDEQYKVLRVTKQPPTDNRDTGSN